MDSLVIAIVVPLMSGLAWVAYAHPKEYFRLSLFIGGLLMLSLVGLMSYDGGYQKGLLEAQKLTKEILVPPKLDLGRYQLLALLTFGYVSALGFLEVLGITKNKSD